MRITGGESKGRTLNFPSRSDQRPTTDFLRSALFNLLESPAGQNVLDLYAGSGSVGLEALSREARTAVFVEKNKVLAGVIHDNAVLCGYPDRCRIIDADVQSALRDLYRQKQRFDMVFADPPYDQGLIGETIRALKTYPVLQEDGILALQHSVREALPSADGWTLVDQRKYGDHYLSFIRMDRV